MHSLETNSDGVFNHNIVLSYPLHIVVGVVVMRLRGHLVGVTAQAVRAQRGRVREALVAPLARQRLVARVSVHVNLITKFDNYIFIKLTCF